MCRGSSSLAFGETSIALQLGKAKNIFALPTASLNSPCVLAHCRNKWEHMSIEQRRDAGLRGSPHVLLHNGRKQHQYQLFLPDGSAAPVCNTFWMDVYQVSKMFVPRLDQPCADRNRTDYKTQSASRWLEEMQKLHEYMPDTVGAGRDDAAVDADPSTRRTGVLLSYAHKKDVWEDYVDDMETEREKMSPAAGARDLHQDGTGVVAGKSLFMRVWKTQHRHIKLRKSTRFSKCDDCVRLRGLIAANPGRPLREQSSVTKAGGKRVVCSNPRTEFQLHLDDIKAERKYYHDKRREAVQNPADVLSIILDGADQGSYGQQNSTATAPIVATNSKANELLILCSGYPHFKEQTKTSSGMFKQKYHLIGALVHGVGPWIYTMSHRFPADPNVTIEVLQRVLTDLSEERGGALPKKLYLQLDNCGRENKNAAVMAYISWLVQRKVFEVAEVSFLPVGHTHEDIDQIWSRTGLQLRSHDVSCEAELFDLIKKSFHHYGFEARCGTLETVANIKEWLAPYSNKVHGLCGREVMHLKFVAHEDGPAIFTKHRAGLGWHEKGHEYKTASKGFHLLKKDTPAPPFAHGVQRPPALLLKQQSEKVLARLQTAWRLCEDDDRVSEQAMDFLYKSLQKLKDVRPIPFSWALDGLLLCERVEGDNAVAPRHAGANAEQQAFLLQAEQQADEVDELLATTGEDRRPRGADEQDDDSDREDDVPCALRTATQEKLRAQYVKDAESEASFVVDVLCGQHFVVYVPEAGDRKQGNDKRSFWVGQVYEDWEDDDGVPHCGVNRSTGDITVHNYTPYNVKKGAATSNTVAKEFADYIPEYDGERAEKWTTCRWDRVLFVLSHLISRAGDAAAAIGPNSGHTFALPTFLKKRLTDMLDNMIPRPVRSLDDYMLTGTGTAARTSKRRNTAILREEDLEMDCDSDRDCDEDYEEENISKKKAKRRKR